MGKLGVTLLLLVRNLPKIPCQGTVCYPDKHEDFRLSNKAAKSDISLKDIVEQDIKESSVMIYMKGVPEQPRCGFSSLALRVLNEYNVHLSARNILEDQELDNAGNFFSHWPSFPQILMKGGFVGGSDIFLDFCPWQTGVLKDILKDLTVERKNKDEL
ncbi:hypothetical protein MKW92_015880 [Papaver armeniacum]|nr:hypothetical protein MKW92_015880 [Papaver armeniacum]